MVVWERFGSPEPVEGQPRLKSIEFLTIKNFLNLRILKVKFLHFVIKYFLAKPQSPQRESIRFILAPLRLCESAEGGSVPVYPGWGLFNLDNTRFLHYYSPMEKAEDIQKQLRELFATQSLAVLATHNEEQPYASLVAFVATDDLNHIYFVTPKTTRKFANLAADGRVALLINNSTNNSADFHRAIAVTAVGDADEMTGPDRERQLSHYLAKHPYLDEFAKSPTCALVRVTVRSYFLVKNFQKVLEYHIVK